MARFQVPQFIDVEDKLFGPFTIKQFVYVAGGGGLIYLYWQLAPAVIAVLLSLPTGALALALAFKKVNGQPFIKIVQAFVGHLFMSKMYIWSQNYEAPQTQQTTPPPPTEKIPSKTTSAKQSSSLKDLSWSLDVLDTSNQ